MLDSAARIISKIFNPLFMPFYGLLIIFTAPTLFGYLPVNVKRIILFIVLVNNVLIPLSLFPYYKYRNIITTWTLENRRERFIPLLITSILYSVTSIIVYRFQIPMFLKSFLFASSFMVIAVTIINFFWKISIHAVSAGSLMALVLILAFRMSSPLYWYLVTVIIAGGLVLASRLRLNMSSPSQVWIGFLTGFSALALFMMLL
jgi:hypothetical protein